MAARTRHSQRSRTLRRSVTPAVLRENKILISNSLFPASQPRISPAPRKKNGIYTPPIREKPRSTPHAQLSANTDTLSPHLSREDGSAPVGLQSPNSRWLSYLVPSCLGGSPPIDNPFALGIWTFRLFDVLAFSLCHTVSLLNENFHVLAISHFKPQPNGLKGNCNAQSNPTAKPLADPAQLAPAPSFRWDKQRSKPDSTPPAPSLHSQP